MFGIEWRLLLLLSLVWLFCRAMLSLLMITILLIILASLAMGMQSATVSALGIPGVVTTYITGTLTSLMGGLSGWLRSTDIHPHVSRLEWPQALELPQIQTMARQAGTWCAYVVGAVCGSIATLRLPMLVSWLPLLTIGLVIIHVSQRLHRS